MRHFLPSLRRQAGVAAIELAIIMGVMAVLLPVTMYISRLLWTQLVVLHETHAAAVTIASASLAELSTGSDGDTFINEAKGMVTQAAEAAHLEPFYSGPDRDCSAALQCKNVKSGTISIDAIAWVTEQHFSDPIFTYDSPDGSTPLRVISTVPYANRPLAQ